MFERIFLSLGSNIGEKENNIRIAIAEIETIATVKKISSLLMTPPWGKTDQPFFCNAAVEIQTKENPESFLKQLQKIEKKMGRLREKKWGPRIIDIDIVFWGHRKMETKTLFLPHPFWRERDFVKNPIREIAPEFLREQEQKPERKKWGGNFWNLFQKIPEEVVLFRKDEWWILCIKNEKENSCTPFPFHSAHNNVDEHHHYPFLGGMIGTLSYSGKEVLFHSFSNGLLRNEKTGEQLLFFTDPSFPKKIVAVEKSPLPPQNFFLSPFSPDAPREKWEKGFEKAQNNIRAGECYQLNLTRQFSASFSGNARALFLEMIRKNPAPHAAFFEQKTETILSVSPELFLSFSENGVMTKPIKGTRPRAKNLSEDENNKAELLASEKEKAELLMITDLLRNDLRKNCSNIEVKTLRAVQKNTTVWHTFSEIWGHRKKEISPMQFLKEMLPAGSVSGCPKKRADQIIEEIEGFHREKFCGVFGFFDYRGNGEFSILIRTLLLQKKKMRFQAGGGITADSKKAEEYAEIEHKSAFFFDLNNTESKK